MNRKWLAGFTFCVLILGLTFALQINGRAQSPVQSQPQAQAPAADGSAEAGWVAAEPFDVFTMPVDPGAVPGLPFGDPAAGDVFFYSADASTDIAFAGPPEFTAALPFPGPDPQGLPPASGVAFVGPDPQDNITFVSFEAGLGNQVVAGAPYSAQVTSEFQQTLQDGNKIERKTTTTVYRDGQGRTRREQTLPAIGPYAASAAAPQAIFINDPVAGVTYVLDPAHKTARKMITRPNIQLGAGGPGRGGPGSGGFAGVGRGRGPGGNPPQVGNGPQGQLGPGQPGPGRPGPGGPPPGNGPRPNARGRDANVSTKSLGTQNMEGVFVEGTLVTRTVPSGTVGNQQPILITGERWYSPDLKLNVMVKNTDPSRGQNTTTLTNIRRDEPSASLFQVPADYTVQEPPNRPRGQRVPPPPPPAPQRSASGIAESTRATDPVRGLRGRRLSFTFLRS